MENRENLKFEMGTIGGNVSITDIEPEDLKVTINNPYNITNFGKINHIMVDKSRTLTTGRMYISSVGFKERRFNLQKIGGN